MPSKISSVLVLADEIWYTSVLECVHEFMGYVIAFIASEVI